MKSEEEQPFEKLVLELASTESVANNKYLQIWVTAYYLLSEEEARPFYNDLKQRLSEYQDNIAPAQVRLLYTYLENSTKRLFPERMDRFQELFSLYKIQINAGVLEKSKSFVQGLFKNIIVVGLALEQFDWVERFIKDHHALVLPEESQKDNLEFGLAKLAFARGEFQDCFERMSSIEYHDFYIKLEAKRLFLKCCYELKEYKLVDSFLNSFRVFNHRLKNVPESFTTSNNNFIKALSRLFQHTTDPNKSGKALQEYINSFELIYDRKWLLQKAATIERNVNPAQE